MDDIFKNLNLQQAEAVKVINGPVLIIAGAGSGKTQALTHRLAYLLANNIDPENILALTFTNKAAEEMRDRVKMLLDPTFKLLTTNYKLQTFMGTFHSLGAKILRQEMHHLDRGNDFIIYDDKDSLALIKESMAGLAINDKQFKAPGFAATISDQKNELIDAEAFAGKAKEFYEQLASRVFLKYENYLTQANAVDFDDLILLPVKIFQQFPLVLEKYQNRYQYILVDEYQDTNQAQYIFLKLLAQKNQNICVVGDDFQAIYGFRGANFRNILNFEKDYPKAKIVLLEENYRSSQNILDAAQGIIEKNIYRTNKKLWTKHESGEKIKIMEVFSENEEAEFITQEINQILRYENHLAQSLNDFVILYRTNAQSRSLEEAILEQGWPYRVIGAFKFYERKEIKDIVSYLRAIQNPCDFLSLKRIINIPPRGLGKIVQEKFLKNLGQKTISVIDAKTENFLNLMAELRNISYEKNLTDFIKILLEKISYKNYILDGTPEGEGRWENIQELLTVADKFNNLTPPQGLVSFLEEVALIASRDDYNDKPQENDFSGKINLMTLHSAKGLEFPVVFIAGAEEGLLPHARSFFDPMQLEEERRLCYVGLTRAKKRAYFVFAQKRNLYGKSQNNPPSRFLGDMPERLVDFKSFNGEGEVLEI